MTLYQLPVVRGYFRTGEATTDVRQCHDSAANCSGRQSCAYGTSGCQGGSDISTQCAPSLRGPFCLLCDGHALVDVSNSSLMSNSSLAFNRSLTPMSSLASNGTERRRVQSYYVAASKTEVAHCRLCDEQPVGLIYLAFFIFSALVVMAPSLIVLAQTIRTRCKPRKKRARDDGSSKGVMSSWETVLQPWFGMLRAITADLRQVTGCASHHKARAVGTCSDAYPG